MTTTAISAPGLSGILRMTWVNDGLAHILEHAGRTSHPGHGPAWHAAIMGWLSAAMSTRRRSAAWPPTKPELGD